MAIESECAAYRAAKADWRRMRDVLLGQTAMQSPGADYLRRPRGMTDNLEWSRYVMATPFFEATQRTLEGLTGLAFYRDPELTLPPAMDAFQKDATQDGVPLRQFTEKVFEEVLGMGRVGVMVDFPKPDPGIRTRRDEEEAGRRPFVRQYVTEDIPWWETGEVNGAVQLTQVRLREIETEKDGDWGNRWRRRLRVLHLVEQVGQNGRRTWTYEQVLFAHGVWETDDADVADDDQKAPAAGGTVVDNTDWEEVARFTPLMDGRPLGYIPFWIINPTDQSPAVKRPPMLGLANINIAHFNTTAALENALFWCGNPQPYVAGIDPATMKEELVVGGSTAWVFKDASAKADFLAYGADGLAPLEKRLDRHEVHMSVLGAKMLSPDRPGIEAAETARIHRQGEVSVLAGVCGSVSRSMSDVVRVVAEWSAVDEAEIKAIMVKIHTAFFDQTLSVEDALGIVEIWHKGMMSPPDVIALFKKGELIDGTRTIEEIVSDNQSSPIQPIMPGLTDGTVGSQPVPPRLPRPAPAA